MGEKAREIGSSFLTHAAAADRTPMTSLARVGNADEAGHATKLPEAGAANQADGGGSKTSRWRRGKRQRILLGSLVALLMVHVLAGVDPRFLGIDFDAGPPLDRCVTEQAVLEFLDGKTVFSGSLMHADGSRVETIALRKERISSLKIQSGDSRSVLLRFNLDHDGRQYPVEASFLLTTSDSPELHYHGWNLFMGQVVPMR